MEYVEARRPDHATNPRGETFTGQVWAEKKLSEPGVTMNRVTFGPGARTYWHRHEQGQILSIASGKGYVGNREGEIVIVGEGDTVWSPPGEEHYHGALEESMMIHDAVSLGTIEWLEEVTDDEYGRAVE